MMACLIVPRLTSLQAGFGQGAGFSDSLFQKIEAEDSGMQCVCCGSSYDQSERASALQGCWSETGPRGRSKVLSRA